MMWLNANDGGINHLSMRNKDTKTPSQAVIPLHTRPNDTVKAPGLLPFSGIGNKGRNYRPYRPCHAGWPADPGGPSRLPENIFFIVRPCSISGVYGFALFDEFVGTDPLDRARFARNVLDFLACWH